MNKTIDKSNKDDSSQSRKRRRAERNRLRTIKYIHKLLDQIAEGASNGFNHQGWCDAAEALQQVSVFLEPREHTAIGESWRMLYIDHGSNQQLTEILERVKERTAGDLADSL